MKHKGCRVYCDVCVTLTHVEVASAGGGGGKELHRVKQQNKQLKEENNLLKIKIDLLLDMVSLQLLQIVEPTNLYTRHTFLVHGQVTIIFVVSVGLSVCLFVCLFVQSFSQPSLIRFRSN